MSDNGDPHNTLLQKLDDHTGRNFARMFLDHNEVGVSAAMTIEMLKASGRFFSEYSEWAPVHGDLMESFDAAVYASASIGGKMRNSFLINRYQAVLTQNPALNGEKKPGFFDGIADLFGGKKQGNGDIGQGDMRRL